jgi:hypothetical protein
MSSILEATCTVSTYKSKEVRLFPECADQCRPDRQ